MLYKALDIVGIGIVLSILMLFGELDEAADLSVVALCNRRSAARTLERCATPLNGVRRQSAAMYPK